MAVVPNRFGIYPLVEGPGRHVYPKTTTFCLVLGFTPSREACRAHQSQNDLEQLSPERPGAASGRGGDVGEAKGAWAKGSAWGAEKVVGRGEGRGAAGRWRGLSVRAWGEARGERRVGWRGTRPWERARAPAKAAGEGSRPHRGGRAWLKVWRWQCVGRPGVGEGLARGVAGMSARRRERGRRSVGVGRSAWVVARGARSCQCGAASGVVSAGEGGLPGRSRGGGCG